MSIADHRRENYFFFLILVCAVLCIVGCSTEQCCALVTITVVQQFVHSITSLLCWTFVCIFGSCSVLKGLNEFPGFVPLVLLEGCLMCDLCQLFPVVSAELCTLDWVGNTSAEQNTDALSVVIDCCSAMISSKLLTVYLLQMLGLKTTLPIKVWLWKTMLVMHQSN